MVLADVLAAQPLGLQEAWAGVDWAATPLGAPELWSPALRQAVTTCLSSRFPMLLSWGPELVMVYNAAYVQMIGDKHPAALGSPTAGVFRESWHQIGPLFQAVLDGGRATYDQDFEFYMDRSGFLEQTYFTFSYSPVHEADGQPGGVLNVTTETTGVVRSRRRLALLSRLGEQLSPLATEADVIEAALAVLRTGTADFTHVVLVRAQSDGPTTAVRGRTVRVSVPLGDSGRDPLDLLVKVHEQLPVDDDLLDVLSVMARVVGGALVVARALADESSRAAVTAQHAARLAALAVALQHLGAAADEESVLTALGDSGARVLQADGLVVVLADEDQAPLRARFTSSFGDRVVDELRSLARDTRLPMVDAAVHGRTWVLGDRDATLAAFPEAQPTLRSTGTQASICLPLRAGRRLLGALALAWARPRAFTQEERDVVDALAAATAQVLDRLSARDAEREAARQVSEIAETLQRSLLPEVPEVPGLAIGNRYLPALDHARVGGDWYDVFVGADGVTRLVVGDVTGHDEDAAAAMGQLRNLLRGTAYAHPGSPAEVLTELDRAMAGLRVGTLATVVLAELQWAQEGSAVVRWSSAGHPPPVLQRADGSAVVLDSAAPDLLLGLDAGTARTDSTAQLDPGDTFLLHTDGLVERRGEDLDDGTDRLLRALSDTGQQPLDQWCDSLLHRLIGQGTEDDVVLLATRLLPRQAPTRCW